MGEAGFELAIESPSGDAPGRLMAEDPTTCATGPAGESAPPQEWLPHYCLVFVAFRGA